MIASLPMYDWPELREQTDQFWADLSQRFQRVGIKAPKSLTRVGDDLEHWRRNDLLFSQTCGYPFAKHLLEDVRLVATPRYGVEGCVGATYSSALVVRASSDIKRLEDTGPFHFAYNGLTSLSGFRCLSPMIGNPLEWFANCIQSGSHRTSAGMVAEGQADIAAVDAVCWHLLHRVEPKICAELRVLSWTPKLPALPFITGAAVDNETVKRMREALCAAIASLPSDNMLPIKGIEVLTNADYASLSNL